ncbi:MFS transporter [Streptomyces sp. NPDC001893]|uniref:MFS transporter n=1 Tax=Streptomyces sp. NPDC001893 TaxID=3154530 RepID=UPI00331C853D
MPADAGDTSEQTRGVRDESDHPTRPWEVLARHGNFRKLFLGNSISLLGSSVTTVALPLTSVVYLHASPTQMGLLGAMGLLPHLVLGLPAGVWADRVPYRRILTITDFAQTLVLGSVPILATCGLLRMWHLYAVVLFAGVANLFETIAAQSFTPLLVPREELLPANSALMLSNAAVNTTGSALGGLLVTVLSAPMAVAVDALSFLVSGMCKASIHHSGRIADSVTTRDLSLRTDILEGLRAVFSHRILRAVILAAAIGAFAGQLQAVVLVLFFVRDLHLASGLVGAAIAVSGVAGILGATMATGFTRRVGTGRAFISGVLVASFGGLVAAAAVGPSPMSLSILLLAQVLRGIGPSMYGVNQQTLRQAVIAPSLLSRANATWRFVVFGGQSLGALAGGMSGSVLGLRATLIASGCMMLVGASTAIASPLRSLRELPARQVLDEKSTAQRPTWIR